jgi:surface-adhesin protein E
VDRIIIFTFIMGLALFNCSSEPEWKFIGTSHESDDNGDYDLYIKPKSIVSYGLERKFWGKSVYRKGQKLNSGNAYTERLVFVAVNCSKKTIQVFEVAFYGSDGSIVDGASYRKPPTKEIKPGSAGERMSEFVCKYK